jgi:hypothetical protein
MNRVYYSTNLMGPINLEWIKQHGEGWCAGRIDIYGEGLYPDEIGLPPMKSEDWGRFSNWLDTFETDYMWTLRMLVSEYEKTNPKIQWHHTPEWEMYNDKESE